jgi:integrase
MPKPRASSLESPTARLKLPVARRPVWVRLAPGIALGYRRNAGAGSWSVRCTANGSQWIKRLAIADDYEPAAPPTVLNYWSAIEAARALGRRQPDAPIDESRPVTVAEALDRYEADLKTRGGSIYNARMPRRHLTGALLSKPVQLLGSGELKRWRDSLTGIEPSSINRMLKCLKAALALAASHDARITNADARKLGLAGLPDAIVARNVILDDAQVRSLVAAAYSHDRALGLFVDVLARTGARPGQAARLIVADLVTDPPRLLMPRSAKGGSRNRVARKSQHFPVPITAALAMRLKAAGRAADAALLRQADGQPWGAAPSENYRDDMRAVVTAVGLDPDHVTLYALRHSSIVRQLLLNVPIRIVAATHDTSVAMIEKHYSRHIGEHSDDLSRRALLQDEAVADNVIPMTGGLRPLLSDGPDAARKSTPGRGREAIRPDPKRPAVLNSVAVSAP